MSLFLTLYPHTCSIVHRAPGPKDELNQPTVVETTTTGVACHWQDQGTRETARGIQGTVENQRMFFPINTAIAEDDAVQNIFGTSGETLATGPLEVASISKHVGGPVAAAHHLEVNLGEAL